MMLLVAPCAERVGIADNCIGGHRRWWTQTCMQLTTSGNSIETSLPTVMAAMTFLTASFFLDLSTLCRSSLNSRISPASSK